MTTPLSTADQVVTATTELLGLAILAGTLAGVVGLGYRWFTRERVPTGLALLVGLAGVAAYLNTTSVLGQVIDGDMGTVQTALFNVGAFLFGGVGALAGRRWGDAFGRDVLNGGERQAVDEDVSRLVKTVGRVTTVTMPQEIDDVVGYDPVSERTREAIAGNEFVFPRNLTVAELDRRVRSRLKTDFGVGTVDLELSDDGTVEYLAVGSRAAGIGPTLPPATNAVALRADPAFAASTGDVVQVWEADAGRRVLTGELRGVAGDVVTVAINSADTPKVDPTRTYRLVTLPVEDRPAREFASLLRSADETYTSVTVEAGSPLHGMPVGALDLTVVGVKPEESEPVALPSREYVLSPGELLYVIGRPETLRKLDRAGDPLDPSLAKARSARSSDSWQESDEPVSEPLEEPTPSATPVQGEQATGESTDAIESPPEPGSAEQPASVTDDTASPATADVDTGIETPGSGGGDSSETESAVAGKADPASFDELKAEYDEGEEWEESDEDSSAEPIEHLAESSGGKSVDDQGEGSEGASFDELKSEFESGDADWDGAQENAGDDGTTEEAAFETDADPLEEDDDLVSLEEADISFDEEEPDETVGDSEMADVDSGQASADTLDSSQDEEFGDLDGGFDDDLADGFDDEFDDGIDDDLSSMDDEDDLSSLTLDDDGDDLFDEDSFEDDELFEDDAVEESVDEEPDEEEEGDETDADEEDDDDEDDDGGGGGSTFAQLKEEFESGDADWEDDVSDSPGGDMRLDE